MKKYTVDYFIKKFKAIPRDDWTTGMHERATEDKTRYCALGHCGATFRKGDTLESRALDSLFRSNSNNIYLTVAAVNDDTDGLASNLGKHPKTRVLNALKRIKQGKKLKPFKKRTTD